MFLINPRMEPQATTEVLETVKNYKDEDMESHELNIPRGDGHVTVRVTKFIGNDGRTAWLCYAANFSVGMPDPPPLESNPPGSRYGMNLQEIRLRAKD